MRSLPFLISLISIANLPALCEATLLAPRETSHPNARADAVAQPPARLRIPHRLEASSNPDTSTHDLSIHKIPAIRPSLKKENTSHSLPKSRQEPNHQDQAIPRRQIDSRETSLDSQPRIASKEALETALQTRQAADAVLSASPDRKRKFTLLFPQGLLDLEPNSSIDWFLTYHIEHTTSLNFNFKGGLTDTGYGTKTFNSTKQNWELMGNAYLLGDISATFLWHPGDGMKIVADYTWQEEFKASDARLKDTVDDWISVTFNDVVIQRGVAYTYTYTVPPK